MPQEESKRGAHFAKRSASQASASEASSVDDQIRNAWSAAADPGETAVYLRAAGAGAALPRTILSSGRPDETAVFLAAAQSRAGRMPAAAGASRAPRPDETAVFLMAAQGKGTLKGAPADRSARHATDGDDEQLLMDDEWSPLGSTDPVEGVAVDDDDWGLLSFSDRTAAAREVDTVFGDDAVANDGASFDNDVTPAGGAFSADDAVLVDDPFAIIDEPDIEVDSRQHTEVSPQSQDDVDDMGSSDYSTVGRSAGLMTALTIVSRVTGFIRTWAMAAAIGMSLLSSSYQVANNLPNMLYELVMGGMLVTAFLPVYMGVRREQGRDASNEYVGNLLGILLLLLGGISVLGTVFAPGFIWTQSFLSGDGGSINTAAFMFRFFAIQILFYGLGSVFSGVLNAHRDYFWSTFAPVLNNAIVIASFMGFAPVSAQFGERAGIILIAAGTTFGVFVQMACQIPALGKHGVHPHIHIDFKDPALRQTITLGIPTLLATVCMFVSTSITNAAALVVQPETGPSVIAYARLWYTLPYALIAASLSTALYTELSHDAQEKDYDSVRTGISHGVAQMLFFLIPFALYLIVFARPLNMIYCAGKFDESGVALVSEFLVYLALSLPLYGVVVLMQKSFSALLDMKPYGRYCLYSAIGQAGSVLLFGVALGYGMPAIALSYVVDYVILVGCSLWWLRRRLHGLQVTSILHGGFFGLLLGGLGAATGAVVMWALEHFVGALGGSILVTLCYVCVAGIVSLAVTFGLAVAFKMPEVSALLRRK
ncbi:MULTISPECIES: murein biosynthesis integral membrane protein MurJ [unclassified Collinsella]|uniref:murein biosynthesis integral membrane protein MurJ n=1 Tax=unclassified Collinsella TaxID=2637548 RepID=UPI001F312FDF|nr:MULTISPECIES: murein biosynthesis integral membrane protein MurJ [unclassified Collinsella]